MKIITGALFAIIFDIILCDNVAQVLRTIIPTLRRTILECGAEVLYSDKIMEHLRDFWESDYSLRYDETGCLFHCMLLKLEQVDMEGALRMANVKALLKANGASEQITNNLIKIYEDCKGSIKFVEFCVDGLQLARCFRETVIQMNWAPERTNPGYNDNDMDYEI